MQCPYIVVAVVDSVAVLSLLCVRGDVMCSVVVLASSAGRSVLTVCAGVGYTLSWCGCAPLWAVCCVRRCEYVRAWLSPRLCCCVVGSAVAWTALCHRSLRVCV